jgi:hypothetical protein
VGVASSKRSRQGGPRRRRKAIAKFSNETKDGEQWEWVQEEAITMGETLVQDDCFGRDR